MNEMKDLIKLIESFDQEYVTKRVVGHKDNESRMMQRELVKIRDYADELITALDQFPDGDFPHWWQSNLVLAGEYMSTIKHFLEGEMKLGPRHADHPTPPPVRSEFDVVDMGPIVDDMLGVDESMLESSTAPTVDGKPVDMDSLEFGDVHKWDRPDYTDAFVLSALFMDGTPLTNKQLNILQDKYKDAWHKQMQELARMRELAGMQPLAQEQISNEGKIDWNSDDVEEVEAMYQKFYVKDTSEGKLLLGDDVGGYFYTDHNGGERDGNITFVYNMDTGKFLVFPEDYSAFYGYLNDREVKEFIKDVVREVKSKIGPDDGPKEPMNPQAKDYAEENSVSESQEADVNDRVDGDLELTPSHTLEYNGREYDVRHGGAFDRGSADAYYRRLPIPHYFEGGTHQSKKVSADQMTSKQLDDYHAGFDYQRNLGDSKDWGEE